MELNEVIAELEKLAAVADNYALVFPWQPEHAAQCKMIRSAITALEQAQRQRDALERIADGKGRCSFTQIVDPNPYATYIDPPRQPDGYIACPFCGMVDFDAPGLKSHLRGDCQPFNDTEELHYATH